MKDKLTAKQEAFCINYFATRNGTQSALKAGYSPSSAYSIAEENLNKPEIQERLQSLRDAVLPDEEGAKDAYNKRINALNEVIEHKIELPVSAGHRIAAVHEVNLMEHTYQEPSVSQDNRVLIINVVSDRAKELVEKIGERLDASQ